VQKLDWVLGIGGVDQLVAVAAESDIEAGAESVTPSA